MRQNTRKTQSKSNKQGKYCGKKQSSCRNDKREDLESKTNDPTWYSSDPALLRDAASIPFSWPVGTPIDLNVPDVSKMRWSVPGICALDVVPVYGTNESKTSALNIAANSLYSFVRHANSGHSNYDAPDLMLYVCAMSQVYSFINYMMRAYGLANLYSQKNRYLPAGLLQASGIDHSKIIDNLADFRYKLNVYINKAASLAVPNNMTLFNRHAFLFQNVYCEGSSIKDQLYLLNPSSFLKFDYDDSGAGMLTQLTWTKLTDGNDPDDLFAVGDQLLAPIIADEDMNIMSGDILKAYGAENCIKLSTVPSDFIITPVYDLTVLEQIKNATVISNADLKDVDVKQDADKRYLVSVPKLYVPAGYDAENTNRKHRALYMNRILTTELPEPGPDTVIESTRFMISVQPVTWTSSTIQSSIDFPVICGSEIVTRCKLFYFTQTSPTSNDWFVSGWDYETVRINKYSSWTEEGGVTPNGTPAEFASRLSAFKYHPAVINFKKLSTGAISFEGINFDVDNYAVIHVDELERLHETAILNMLHVPIINRV